MDSHSFILDVDRVHSIVLLAREVVEHVSVEVIEADVLPSITSASSFFHFFISIGHPFMDVACFKRLL